MPITFPIITPYRTETGRKITWQEEYDFWVNTEETINNLISRCNALNGTSLIWFKLMNQSLDGLVWSNRAEILYRNSNPDVVAAINAGTFNNGWHHYFVSGYNEGRLHYENNGWFDVADAVCLMKLRSAYDLYWGSYSENAYLTMYADIANSVSNGWFESGWHHYIFYGRKEGRSIQMQGFTVQKTMDMAYLICDPHWAWSLRLTDYNRNLGAIEDQLNSLIVATEPQGVPQVPVVLKKHTGEALSGLDRDRNCATISQAVSAIDQYLIWAGA